MTEPDPSAATDPAAPRPDWEAFYASYRKPGYIAGFEIQQKLGGGMFGLVFKARRMSIGKDYAIKFLQVDDVEVQKAVLSELEQVKYFAQIDHPNLVAIEDRGVVDGIPFLVMAYAGSETLRDRMPVDAEGRGRAPTPAEKDELVRAFLQCCRGLQALHERSLVHFDIKPANVFLKGSVARLGDYGLSKLVTHSRGSLSMGRGTPYYMAPEMLRRRGDVRSDIYSLGVMLYELLCGKVPFAGDSEWEVLKKHETAAPEWPAHLTANERAVLQRCLEKDPARRYASVQELIVAMGAPATAGAAAMGEPASSGAAPRRDAGSAGEKTDAEREESRDAYKAMAEASKEALRNASVVTRHAMRDAQRAARKAAVGAQRWWHDSMRQTGNFGLRRMEAMKRLWRQKKDHKERARVARIASRVARPERRRHGLRGALWTFAALLVAMLLLSSFWLAAGSSSSPRAYTTASVVYDAPVPAMSGSSPTFRVFQVPSRLVKLVSVSEPKWAAMAADDPVRARSLLKEHIEKLRDNAPIAPDERTQAELPAFRLGTHDVELASQRRLVDALLANPQYDPMLARNIAEGPIGMVALAEAMIDLPWRSGDDMRSAKRLQRTLRDATGCRDLELYESPDLGRCAAFNRPLGRLWLWFVNEFAHTDRAWRVYRQMLNI